MSKQENLIDWPDSDVDMPPRDHPYRAATWLLARHPMAARLAVRAGVVSRDDRGELDLDIDRLAEMFVAWERYAEAWKNYGHPPRDDAAYERWVEAGPQADDFAPGLSAITPMSSSEVRRLRLLATFSDVRVPFHYGDTQGMDAEGQQFVYDWAAAMKVA